LFKNLILKYFTIDEYEREETRQVYVDLNSNIEVSSSKNLNIFSRDISNKLIVTKIGIIVLAQGIIIYLLIYDYIQ